MNFCRNVFDLKELNSTYIGMVIWYSGILGFGIILLKTVFSCLDEYWSYHGIFLEFLYCALSWSRGYFHVSIERVFSCLDQEGIFNRIWFELDLYLASLAYYDSFHLLMNIKEELNLTFIWSSVLWNGLVFSLIAFPSESTYETVCFGWVLIRNFLLTSKDIGKGILRTKFF